MLVSGLALLVLIVLVAGVLVVRPGPVDGWLSAEPAPAPSVTLPPDPAPTPVLAPAGAGGAAPSATGVTAAIGKLAAVAALGTLNASVIDGATGDVLFEQNPATLTTPASTTKLLTAATVLAARGPAYRLTTRAVAGTAPGEVVLIGGGDPTLAVDGDDQFPGAARLDKLADQVKKALGGQPATRVVVDTSLYAGPELAPGWDSGLIAAGQVARIQALTTNAGRVTPVHNEFGGDRRFSDPALSAGKAFAAQLGVASGAVSRGKAPVAGASAGPGAAAVPSAAVAPGSELGAVRSPPLVHVVDWMLDQSDNVLAEAMARQVALAAGEEASFAGGATAMLAKLTELGLPAGEAKLSDASGLSRLNKVSPGLLTDVLQLAAGGTNAQVSAMLTGLPVAGWSGTLRRRFETPAPNQAGQGLVRAKTGSLSGVNTMSGQLITRDGRLLLFALMASGNNSVTARQALDRIATTLVACGCQ